ncbi:MAG: hypothetical protein ABIT83_06625 [Massilia sp.]
MRPAVTAALLSGLVFPGAGQVYLRRPWRACLFALPTLWAAVYFVGQVWTRVSAMRDQVLSGSVPLDPAVIGARLEHDGSNTALLSVATWVMLLCWLVSIADAWWLGRQGRPEVKRKS